MHKSYIFPLAPCAAPELLEGALAQALLECILPLWREWQALGFVFQRRHPKLKIGDQTFKFINLPLACCRWLLWHFGSAFVCPTHLCNWCVRCWARSSCYSTSSFGPLLSYHINVINHRHRNVLKHTHSIRNYHFLEQTYHLSCYFYMISKLSFFLNAHSLSRLHQGPSSLYSIYLQTLASFFNFCFYISIIDNYK